MSRYKKVTETFSDHEKATARLKDLNEQGYTCVMNGVWGDDYTGFRAWEVTFFVSLF
jgi:hypothetical protein